MTGHDHALPLDPAHAPEDPAALFARWFDQASEAGVALPHQMALATVGPEGAPTVRAVLMKGHGPAGLDFYTNRQSEKGQQLAVNPQAAVCFVWTPLHRQVRARGNVVELDDASSDAYWAERPPRARAGAAASPQSRVLASRSDLLAEVEALERRFPDGVPRPDHWGGYRLEPTEWEFWQGREDRLHDRVRYRREHGRWIRERLAP